MADTYLRRYSLYVNTQPSAINISYGYDNASRLLTVGDGNGNSATYTYLDNSPLVGQIEFKQGTSATPMKTAKQYDYLNRLISISNSPSSSAQISYSYQYNNANQRVRTTLADGNYWIYQYDKLGQVTSGKKYWADGTLVAGQQFQYGFDDIGNRTSAQAGGDDQGLNPRRATYWANSVNQYTSRTVPGGFDVIGVALANSAVAVNGSSPAAYRKGEYFRKQLTVDNSTTPLWQLVTVSATGQPDVTGNQFVPQTPEQFYYDLDGNLTSDGRWTYTWDGENRLISMVTRTSVDPARLMKFEYDAKGRRIRKQVWNDTVGSGDPALDLKFLYDGWNLMAEVTGGSLVRSYIWGTDLSGSLQGAGGVGGLLEMAYYDGTSTTKCFAAYDGNGNLTALIKDVDGTTVANYEYGPFGEPIRVSGVMANQNPICWSTKYTDDESGLLNYGYRYYNASTGRWLSRDPLEEAGGLTLYGFLSNDPLDSTDAIGLKSIKEFIRDGVTGSAAILTRLFAALAAWSQAHPGSVNDANAILDWLRPYLLKVVDTNPKTMGWTDLTLAWLLEGGPISGSFDFDATARTTGDLRGEEGVKQTRELARAKLREMRYPGTEVVTHTWRYNQDAFYTGLGTLDLATSFTGSYDVIVTIKCPKDGPNDHYFTFGVLNSTTWESGTRLNKNHTGIIPDRPRNGAGLHLGGNMREHWGWTED